MALLCRCYVYFKVFVRSALTMTSKMWREGHCDVIVKHFEKASKRITACRGLIENRAPVEHGANQVIQNRQNLLANQIEEFK